ncbi:MAG: 4Fe-4S binding protein [Sphaerochaetaceae bacterium]
MAKEKTKLEKLNYFRILFQGVITFVSNSYIVGFIKGKIYQGNIKSVCFPGLNCYSCPGAIGSCPIGSLQASLGSRGRKSAFYVGGLLASYGLVGGRFICGWLCPFGWIEDLLFKIPFVKKVRKLPFEAYLEKIRYLVLIILVLLLPAVLRDITGLGKPFFCSYACPKGTLSGLFLMAANPPLRSIAGSLFAWKLSLLIVTIIASIIIYRPFCRYICPLGAIYGLFNKVSLYHFEIDTSKCSGCALCQEACKLDINVFENPNSSACIRCRDCIAACPYDSIKERFKIQDVVKNASDYQVSASNH